MRKNRTALSVGLMTSTVVALIYAIDFINKQTEEGFSSERLLWIILCFSIIAFNVSAFVTTDKNNEEFKKVRWRSVVSFVLYFILYIYQLFFQLILNFNAGNRTIVFATTVFISTPTLILILLGMMSRTRSSYSEKKEKDEYEKKLKDKYHQNN